MRALEARPPIVYEAHAGDLSDDGNDVNDSYDNPPFTDEQIDIRQGT
jgi:hypothetical protein